RSTEREHLSPLVTVQKKPRDVGETVDPNIERAIHLENDSCVSNGPLSYADSSRSMLGSTAIIATTSPNKGRGLGANEVVVWICTDESTILFMLVSLLEKEWLFSFKETFLGRTFAILQLIAQSVGNRSL